ncbi:MAG: ABC transporter ATP-binding protein [Alphaproteobacteria bacterium]
MGEGDVPALLLAGVRRTFSQAGQSLKILRDVSLSIQPGEMVALVGPSGSGKSTLLQIAGLLEKPDDGTVVIGGTDSTQLSEAGRTKLRLTSLGFIYQFHHLLPEFSALENVMLPQMIHGKSRKEAQVSARELLVSMGLAERLTHRPARLSGGEQQRVAIVRAIANSPRVLLADEPTGNLDPTTAEDVFAQLVALVRDTQLAALVATHNFDLAKRMDRAITLHDGHIEEATF